MSCRKCPECRHYQRPAAPEPPPSWALLSPPVTLVTPHRGREVYTEARPLMIRLRELVQGEVEIMQISVGGRAWTETTIRALEWYLQNLTYNGLQDSRRNLTPDPGPVFTRMAWEHLLRIISPEYMS